LVHRSTLWGHLRGHGVDHESVFRLDPQPDRTWACVRMTYDTTAPTVSVQPGQLDPLRRPKQIWRWAEARTAPIPFCRWYAGEHGCCTTYQGTAIDGMVLILMATSWRARLGGQRSRWHDLRVCHHGRAETHPSSSSGPAIAPWRCDLRSLYVTTLEATSCGRTDRQGLLHFSPPGLASLQAGGPAHARRTRMDA
jgi:hypothetical protein